MARTARRNLRWLVATALVSTSVASASASDVACDAGAAARLVAGPRDDRVGAAGAVVRIPAGTTLASDGPVVVEAASALVVDGAVVGRSVTLRAPLVVVTGTVATIAGGDGRGVSVRDGLGERVHTAADGLAGGDIVIDAAELAVGRVACLATGDGGAGAAVVAWDSDVSADTAPTIQYTGGAGGRGGDVVVRAGAWSGIGGAVYLGSPGAGGDAIAHYRYADSVRHVVATGGAAGRPGIVRDAATGSYLDAGGRARSGRPADGGGALVALRGGPLPATTCASFAAICADGHPVAADADFLTSICTTRAPNGAPGPNGVSGDGTPQAQQRGGNGGHGAHGTGDTAQGAPGSPGLPFLPGGNGGDAIASGSCGGHGGWGGDGGNGVKSSGALTGWGGRGGDGGDGGFGGYANATGGPGGSGRLHGEDLGSGGDGGDAHAHAGNGGNSGIGGDGGDGGCGVNGHGGRGGDGAEWASYSDGGNGGDATAVPGSGGSGTSDGTNGQRLEEGGDGGNGRNGGIGGGGNDPGNGGFGGLRGFGGSGADVMGANGSHGGDGSPGVAC